MSPYLLAQQQLAQQQKESAAMSKRDAMMFLSTAAAVVSALVMGATTAFAADDWVCGDWKADTSGKCEEVRTCTRTKCDDIQKLETCKRETKTECANPKPLPPKPAPRYDRVAPPVGGSPPAADPGRGNNQGPPGGPVTGATPGTLDAGPKTGPAPQVTQNQSLDCQMYRNWLRLVNTTGRVLRKGQLIRWRTPLGASGVIALSSDLGMGGVTEMTVPPQAALRRQKGACTATVVLDTSP